ncbi:MAG: type II secretion system protein GspK [Phycisphaerae bacterium]
MIYINNKYKTADTKQHGVVLMVVMVLLIVLSTIGYTISTRVSSYRQRQQYMVDYQSALYARDSAIKYALTAIADINEPNLIVRAEVPDFSDTFLMSESQIKAVLEEWAQTITEEQAQQYYRQKDFLTADANSLKDFNDLNDLNDLDFLSDISAFLDFNSLNLPSIPGIDINDTNLLEIPGPYGPRWPLITQPIRLKIGTSEVTIEIHDENAKYPIGWTMLEEPEVRREVVAGFRTFCEWMSVDIATVEKLENQMLSLNETKKYQTAFREIRQTTREEVPLPISRARTAAQRRTRQPTRYRTRVTVIPATVHYADFGKLLHSPLIDTESLARPTIASPDRMESALKYINVWGTGQVNINSAPRQVLEAAFTFGGNAQRIAQQIIEQRQIKPFESYEDIKERLLGYSDSIEKCRSYIVTQSDFFTIRITANSGAAKTSAVIAVIKLNNKFEQVAVLTG